ncbi:hypothetical protein SUGI_0946730 [Cryptomeria japonica]|uniref:protein TPX2 n=1 Tax=Cryptomeria japonica TaxID=3369 RepID=UPI002414C49A|nr:protein TPX2 [Cryptomeria japonica]GLJ44975.1 hypothetical protein SUGI_0946730 [Cryptomeria japonica]
MEDGWVEDPDYEFSAPHYFDFVRGETEEEAEDAQNWFRTAATYPASPYVAKIKERETLSDEIKESLDEVKDVGHEHPDTNMDISVLNFDDLTSNQREDMTEDMEICTPRGQVNAIFSQETVKRVPPFSSKSTLTKPTASHLAKRIDSSVRGRRDVKSMKQVKGRCTPTVLVNKEKVVEKSTAEENQAVKRQKLDGGRLRQIHNVKEQVLPHKVSSALSATKEKFVCAYNERGYTASSKGDSVDGVSHPVQLKLTVPKEPALVTAQRSRPVRVKSTAELEEELLAKMPKFKARPLNKKILEASSLPLPPKSVPQLPVFQEFNLKTSERAMQHCPATSSLSSSTDSVGITEKHHLKSAVGGGLTEPRMPHLETALRARPPKVKSSEELQKEELENVPKFKARPLNKKIFSSRGDLGVFRHFKRQVTKPEEFHFKTDERCHASPAPADLFMKLSLNSEPSHDTIVRSTKPKPFHLLTEERGAEKERKLMLELQEQENKEYEARIPKANPLPYTIDFPVIPPKPEPKECTKPEPFQLESLMRHEEELQRMMEERARAEREEAEMRKFRAQPIKSNVPVHIPEVPRMPLTEVQEFTFHVDARAAERMEFDKKVLEKQNMYKRYREEYEAAKKADEEREIKIMRKAMVPHARPMPHFSKPFVPERSSKDLTDPKSPKFCVLQHKYDGWLSTLSTQKR